MLTQSESQRIAEKVLKFSTFPDCTVSVTEDETAYVRFANNGVTTSAFTLTRTVNVSSTRDTKTGSSSTNDLSDDGLRAAVRRSEEIAAFAPANPEYIEPLGPQKYPEYDHWDEGTAAARGPQLVPHVKAVIDTAAAKKLIAAGYFESSAYIESFANKKGNFGYARETDSRLSTTVRNAAGTSSGWAGQPSARIASINGADVGARAVEKCARWTKPLRLEPGKYTVVLEPTAVGDIVGNLGSFFQARAAEEGRSFLSKQGGGTLLGEKVFPEIITLRSDPTDRRYPTWRWSAGFLPTRPVSWVEKGIVKNLIYDRYWAEKTGKPATPFAENTILEGGNHQLADLIKATERGLLVTRFWYIRMVNPQTVQLTGLTRDGLFLIEKGEVTQPVVNLRFTDSPVRLLQNTTMLGRNERTRGGETGMIAPPLQARDFTFTSVSDAV
ncbi:MAG TPA: TldD/PmbA family protein [Bryobacteraceae bacterium]|nr:TldD/PmbA family protein [Bryobacteraceae bacterium]